MSPHEAVSAARAHYRWLSEQPESVRDCEFCCATTEHRLEDGDEAWACMPCELESIVRMAEAARDYPGVGVPRGETPQ